MSNSIGLLVLVLTLVTVSSGSARIELGNPVIGAAPEGKDFLILECRGERVHLVSDPTYTQDVDLFLQGGPAGSFVGRHFRVECEQDGSLRRVRYEPLEGVSGWSLATTATQRTELQEFLGELDPTTEWIYVLARPDSFETLRSLREQILSAGLQMGWEPWQVELPIAVVNSGGMVPTIDGGGGR
ncbi:MAG TPA: hypothetical protein VJP77_00190 [Planctomycetota bacterium]|nr:hypothetical protein [Planctomycetota bacterium]